MRGGGGERRGGERGRAGRERGEGGEGEPDEAPGALGAAGRALREALAEQRAGRGDPPDPPDPGAPEDAASAAAARLGRLAAEEGVGVGELLTSLLRLAGDVDAKGPGSPPASPSVGVATSGYEAGRIAELVARAADAWEEAREERREAWLAFLTHEVKNPLNTVLNALWLLREHPGAAGSGRFLELAERGVRRIEALLKELRALHEMARQPAPTGPRPSPPPAPAEPPR